jgi:hypothetical protein
MEEIRKRKGKKRETTRESGKTRKDRKDREKPGKPEQSETTEKSEKPRNSGKGKTEKRGNVEKREKESVAETGIRKSKPEFEIRKLTFRMKRNDNNNSKLLVILNRLGNPLD